MLGSIWNQVQLVPHDTFRVSFSQRTKQAMKNKEVLELCAFMIRNTLYHLQLYFLQVKVTRVLSRHFFLITKDIKIRPGTGISLPVPGPTPSSLSGHNKILLPQLPIYIIRVSSAIRYLFLWVGILMKIDCLGLQCITK